MTLPAPPSYHSDYQPPPRDKPVSTYYDPTSDSSERRPSESGAWSEGKTQTPQVRRSSAGLKRYRQNSIANIISQSRDTYTYPTTTAEPPKYYNHQNGSYTSPVTSTFPPRSPVSHSHPQAPQISESPSLAMASPVVRHNGVSLGGPVTSEAPAPVTVSAPSFLKAMHLVLTPSSTRHLADQRIRWRSQVFYRLKTLHQNRPLRSSQNPGKCRRRIHFLHLRLPTRCQGTALATHLSPLRQPLRQPLPHPACPRNVKPTESSRKAPQCRSRSHCPKNKKKRYKP